MLSRQWLTLLFIPWIHHRSQSDLGAGIPSQKASVSLSVKWDVADPTAGCGGGSRRPEWVPGAEKPSGRNALLEASWTLCK